MKLLSNIEIRRCRPSLGTFVEIAAYGRDEKVLCRGIESAFAAVARVHRLMSFHDPASDVSRMNREAFPKGVTVHPWTWRVMKSARDFAQESDGVFDVTVGALLAKWNYLPRCGCHPEPAASWRNIFLRRNREVFFNRQLIVDLGGIAKGFAVDRAIDALQRVGVSAGIVNAGGDLRVFGPMTHDVRLRNPAAPTIPCGVLRLRDRAIATTALYFSRDARTSPLVHGQRRRSLTSSISVTVGARDCMTADALTKIAFALREKSAPMLKRHFADALLTERDGSLRWTFQSHAA
jgi:FAD:protein FMN transferase